MTSTASDTEKQVGRFAPSPTGPLHLGSLVAALGSYLVAKRAGGLWLLRMEDLDLPRVVPGIADDMLATLEKLGFQWDGEVLYQSRRTEHYRAAAEQLQRRGLAYACGCTRSEIAQIASAPHEDGLVYPGLCRNGLPLEKVERALRIKVYDEVISFDDGIMGRYSQHLTASCGDFVIHRADGPYAYHLAVVVDDAASGVNQVVRGADLLASTPRQIYLQRIFGFPTPSYYHLPLVTGPDGAKLSKRDNAVSLAAGRDLDREGGRLLFAALRFLGQAPPPELQDAAPAELLEWGIAHLDVSAIPRTPAPFVYP
ncbi:tRNA glutamyl-Q(34) synthetase GluQRS [Geomonas sp. Red69]|uniref:tRNA glutamyl-Q(34) synthetase GluQRS n=1 Tax=Geomonas diazotrophica TaxID=2843197 RepID=UPI001C0FA2CE|nr:MULTISPECIES: tRNA glutamyl-Q(34) synthetase GluQRS [Geomonas]MBU5636601.1 tRNA glutamyl-Q(34) synthetase GluQRS [Geomonas diazotrophica]QXE87762.1 tRNA glutamyl-Q(34) synthetase GluQRS [Geomonas nitrogeniifigens]